jgi:hypothetical protein
MNYPCEACKEHKVTRNMIYYSPFCLACQIINNNLTLKPKMAEFQNKLLREKFKVPDKEVKKKMELNYWKSKFNKIGVI